MKNKERVLVLGCTWLEGNQRTDKIQKAKEKFIHKWTRPQTRYQNLMGLVSPEKIHKSIIFYKQQESSNFK